MIAWEKEEKEEEEEEEENRYDMTEFAPWVSM